MHSSAHNNHDQRKEIERKSALWGGWAGGRQQTLHKSSQSTFSNPPKLVFSVWLGSYIPAWIGLLFLHTRVTHYHLLEHKVVLQEAPTHSTFKLFRNWLHCMSFYLHNTPICLLDLLQFIMWKYLAAIRILFYFAWMFDIFVPAFNDSRHEYMKMPSG